MSQPAATHLNTTDNIEWIELGDYVTMLTPGMIDPIAGKIVQVNVDAQYALVESSRNGIRRWASIDEIRLTVKGTALTAAAEAAVASA